MRIFSGSARGRFVNAPAGADLRPTTDRVRLAVFNATSALIPGCRFLDLFCGTGSMGLEALSRGAERAVFVDSQRACADSVKAAAAAFGFPDTAWEVHHADFRKGLQAVARRGGVFDVVYVDPPYDAALGKLALAELLALKVLAEGEGMRVLLEHSSEDGSPEVPGLALYRRYDHGAAAVSVYGHPLAEADHAL
jgi:16S rRNA (guanine(966)-N(2))-methyltransferase RsmD